MSRISHKELAKRVSELSGMPHWEAKVALYTVTRAIRDVILEGNSVVLYNFGTFHFKYRKPRTIPARTMRNPLGKLVQVPETKTSESGMRLKFTPAQQLLNKLKERKIVCPPSKPPTTRNSSDSAK